MQALQIQQHGPVSELKAIDVPRPIIGPDEVLIEIEASALNPSDAVSAEGRFPHSPLPRILGRDFAGRVFDGPTELIGVEIWGAGGDLGISRDGTHAEYIAIPKSAVSRRPNTLSAEEAAAVGVPYQTAWSALFDQGRLQANEWVIISGAAGAVGSAAVQLAFAHGAKVIALIKNEGEHQRLDLPKIAAIAHSASNDLAEVVRIATGGKGAALAVNGVGGSLFQSMLDALADSGRMVVFSAIGGREVPLDILSFYRRNLTLHGLNTAIVSVSDGARIMDQLTPLFESGALAPPKIAERYPLSRAAEAYGRLTQGSGKIALIPDRQYREKNNS